MSSFDKGVDMSIYLIKWLLNILGGIAGFLLPFVVIGVILVTVCLITYLIFDRSKP